MLSMTKYGEDQGRMANPTIPMRPTGLFCRDRN